MKSTKQVRSARQLHFVLFGDYSRYALTVMATRFGGVEFFVSDASIPDPDNAGRPKLIRQCSTLAEAIGGLPEADGCFCRKPAIGDFVINLGNLPAYVDGFHENPSEGIFLRSVEDRREKWLASPDSVIALK